MDELQPAIPESVPQPTAKKILQSAAELDSARDEMVDVQELRRAALEAGISSESFDTSVSQYGTTTPPERREPTTPAQRPSYMGLVGAGMLGAGAAVTLVSLVVGPPPVEVLAGALAAGVGSISAVLAYLRLVFRTSSSSEDPDGGAPAQ